MFQTSHDHLNVEAGACSLSPLKVQDTWGRGLKYTSH